MKKNKEKKSGKKIILLLAVIAVIAAAGAGYQIFAKGNTGQDSAASASQEENTATAEIGPIEVTAEGTGSVEAASEKTVSLDYAGTIDKIYVEAGDQVKAGDVLAVYDQDAIDSVIQEKETSLSDIDSQIASLNDAGTSYISAKVSGRVKRIYGTKGSRVDDVMSQYGCLAEISADGKLKAEFTCTDGTPNAGDAVTVTFDSYSVEGHVTDVSGSQVTVTISDDTSYQVDQTATIYNSDGVLLGEGQLKSNSPYLVTAEYGTIKSVSVTTTTKISAGSTLFTLEDYKYNKEYTDLLNDRNTLVTDLWELKNYRKNPQVVSQYDGYIASLDAAEGVSCEKGQQFCTVADTQALTLKVNIDELDIDGVKQGESVQVVFDAFEDETFEGTVEKVSGTGENSGGVTTYTVTVSLAGNEKLRPAMNASAKIIKESREDALLVPSDAIKSENGERYVEKVENGSTEKTAVTVGLVNNQYAEITSGLNAGDTVVIPSQGSTNQDVFETMTDLRSSVESGQDSQN